MLKYQITCLLYLNTISNTNFYDINIHFFHMSEVSAILTFLLEFMYFVQSPSQIQSL